MTKTTIQKNIENLKSQLHETMVDTLHSAILGQSYSAIEISDDLSDKTLDVSIYPSSNSWAPDTTTIYDAQNLSADDVDFWKIDTEDDHIVCISDQDLKMIRKPTKIERDQWISRCGEDLYDENLGVYEYGEALKSWLEYYVDQDMIWDAESKIDEMYEKLTTSQD